MTVIIDGKKVADLICDNLKKQIEKENIKPNLAVILANDNDASRIYVSSKEKKCASLGIKSTVYKFEKSVTLDKAIS